MSFKVSDLKVGNAVAVIPRVGRAERRTVVRVTPTGQIVLDDGSRWNIYGRKVGKSRDLSRLGGADSIEAYNAPIIEQARRAKYIGALADVVALRKLSTSTLAAMYQAMQAEKEANR